MTMGMSPDTGVACSVRPGDGVSLSDALREAVRAAEDCAVASWWAPGDREALAQRSYEPTLGLHVVAGVSRALRLVISGDIPSLYSAPVRAKQIATLDWFSGGRVEHGIDLAPVPDALIDESRPGAEDSVGQAIDQTAAMHALWTSRRATHSGPHISFDGAISLPKPAGNRVPVTHLRATTADRLVRYVDVNGAPQGWAVWSDDADEVERSRSVLGDVLGSAADVVRLTWVVSASQRASRKTAAALGVHEVVSYFDRIPTPGEIEKAVA